MVNSSNYVPQAGDIVWITLNPPAGHEQSGRRPAVVISPQSYNNKTGLSIFCPITSQIKGYPFEIVLPDGLPVNGVILSDQVKSLDWTARNVQKICSLSEDCISEVIEKLTVLLSR
jgi:mRNA interferase MazF